jgi:hypothetical protein
MTGGFAKGYPIVGMYVDGKRKHKTVHSLVAAAFIGPRPNGMQVNHKDGVITNNPYRNLEYCTPKENIRHGVRELGVNAGVRNGSAKLTPEDVRQIRLLYVPRKMGSHRLAKRFGVSKRAIYTVLSGETWSHVQ